MFQRLSRSIVTLNSSAMTVPLAKALAQLAPENIIHVDHYAVEIYNRSASDKYRIRDELEPYAFEGDLANARIVMLLSNPGYGQGSSLASHTFRRDGWPLSAIHPDAPAETYRWNRRLLKSLIELFGAQLVSQRVAKLELTPWASKSMDTKLLLPSRALVLNVVNRLAQRGIVIVVLRSEALWLQAEDVARSKTRFRVKNWRSASVSPGNLSAEAWAQVVEAMARP